MMTQWQQASLEGLANCGDSLGIDPLIVHVPKNYIDPNTAKLQQKNKYHHDEHDVWNHRFLYPYCRMFF